jgi:hypothetical protein
MHLDACRRTRMGIGALLVHTATYVALLWYAVARGITDYYQTSVAALGIVCQAV